MSIDEELYLTIDSSNNAYTKTLKIFKENNIPEKDIIKEERARRKGRPRKEEGGTKENEQKEQTSNK